MPRCMPRLLHQSRILDDEETRHHQVLLCLYLYPALDPRESPVYRASPPSVVKQAHHPSSWDDPYLPPHICICLHCIHPHICRHMSVYMDIPVYVQTRAGEEEVGTRSANKNCSDKLLSRPAPLSPSPSVPSSVYVDTREPLSTCLSICTPICMSRPIIYETDFVVIFSVTVPCEALFDEENRKKNAPPLGERRFFLLFYPPPPEKRSLCHMDQTFHLPSCDVYTPTCMSFIRPNNLDNTRGSTL